MQIPKNTLSASQFRTYGTGGFKLEDHEDEKGCPAKYKARYVDGLKDDGNSYPLMYGRFFHDIMFLMEQKQLTPDEAMQEAWDPSWDQAMWTEAREDLDNYLGRDATPGDRFGIIENEQELSALLYIDEEFGPVYYRGFLDVIAIDVNLKDVLHIVDYKTNRSPARTDDLLGDVQMRGYHWLAKMNWEKWLPREPKIVTHLDVVKFRDVEIVYSDADIEDWHTWAVAVARKILRDETAEPIINPGCGHCFVRDTCPAFVALPSIADAQQKEGSALEDPVQKLAWRDKAHKTLSLLKKGVDSIDAEFKTKAEQLGRLVVGDQMFVKEVAYSNLVDIKKLHELLGDENFYKVVTTSKTAIEKMAKTLPASDGAQIKAVISNEATGTKITRRKAGGGF